MNEKERDKLLTRLRGIKETIENGSGDYTPRENKLNIYSKLEELLGEKHELEETFPKRFNSFLNGPKVRPAYHI